MVITKLVLTLKQDFGKVHFFAFTSQYKYISHNVFMGWLSSCITEGSPKREKQ